MSKGTWYDVWQYLTHKLFQKKKCYLQSLHAVKNYLHFKFYVHCCRKASIILNKTHLPTPQIKNK